MPTVLRSGPYRFYFFSNDRREPPHVHVDAGGNTAKLWLNPIAVARNVGFSVSELNRIRSVLMQNQAAILEAWYEYFGK